MFESECSQIHRNRQQSGGFQGLGQVGRSGKSFNGYGFAVLQDKRVMKMDVVDGQTTVWMYVIPLNRTLRNG